MGLKVLGIKEFIVSHVLIVVGLILITVGIVKGPSVALIIAGIWVGAVGLCSLFGTAFKKIAEK